MNSARSPECVRVLQAFDRQAAWCRESSPFTARLLDRSRRWLAGDDAALAAFAAATADPLAAALSLRWAGALHHLALRGIAPWAAIWPPARDPDTVDDAELDDAVVGAWQTQFAAVRAALAGPPQTNEVQRSAALLPGLLHISALTGRPLALVEIGASAGLNLWCERYHYDCGVWQWGDPTASLALRCEWRGPPPAAAAAPLRVVRRAGCDAQPIDITQPDEALRLASFVWPDQAERLARLRTAQRAVAGWMADERVAVQAQTASSFVAEQLAAVGSSADGVATVLMHSVVWQYLGRAEQSAIEAALLAAAERATLASPLAWLRFEPPAADLRMELRCRLWPGGDERLLAVVHPHGAWVEWCG